MSKSLNLTLTLLKRSGKEIRFLVIITTVISALVFNFMNLMMSDRLLTKVPTERMIIAFFLCCVLAGAFFDLYKANEYLLKVKSNEIGIEALSGISQYSLGFLLTVQTSILNFLGYFLGIALGIIISPIFNFFAFKEFSFQINIQSLLYMLAFFILQSFMIGLINQGFGYRNEIVELLGINDKSQFISERYVKKLTLVNWIAIPMMLSMFIIPFTPYTVMENTPILGAAIIYIPVLGCMLFFRNFLPLFLEKLKDKRFLNHKYHLIVISNLKTSINKNRIIFSALLVIGMIFPTLMILKGYTEITMIFNVLAYVLVILFVTFLMIFNGLTSSIDEIKVLTQLRVLGYSKNEIKKILRNKITIFYLILIGIPSIFTTIFMVYLVQYLNFSLAYGIIYIGVYILIFLLVTIIIYKYSVKELNKNLG